MSDARLTEVEPSVAVTFAARLAARGEELRTMVESLRANTTAIEAGRPQGSNPTYAGDFETVYLDVGKGAAATLHALAGAAERIVDCGYAIGVGAMTVEDRDAESGRAIGDIA